MTGQNIARPAEIPLPDSESLSLQLDEDASNHPETPRGSASNEDDDTPELKTMSFEAFVHDESGRRPLFRYRSPSVEVANLATQNFPLGGMVAIPVPSSPDALPDILRRSSWINLYHDSWNISSRNDPDHPDQDACWNSAEFAWNHWLEYAEKPELVVFESEGFQFKGAGWFKDDLIGARREDTVKLWISHHFLSELTSPALLSAELHIMINSMLDDEAIKGVTQSRTGRLISPLVWRYRSHASRIIIQHMGSWTDRPSEWSRSAWPSLFNHRITMFVAVHPSLSFHQVTVAHRRAHGRFPARESSAKSSRLSRYSFHERCISIVAGFQDAKDGNTLRCVLIRKDEVNRYFGSGFPVKDFEDLSLTERAGFLPALLRQYYLLWKESWNSCLDVIDDSVRITLEDLSDDTKLDTFMFDGTNFERSRSYFAALQLLRIFSDRIKETRQGLIQAIKALGQDMSLFESTGLEEAESRLLQRIDRKTEEIKTLRDGLFNSTSVREATRATQMNRYVIVFTVVTVLYTPPSFISALFATPLPYFTKGDPDDFKRAVGIATGTTVLAAAILLVIANSLDEIVRNPKTRLGSMTDSAATTGLHLLETLAYIVWYLQRKVREAGRRLQKAAETVRQETQASDTPSQRPGSRTDQRHSEEVIDLSTLDANDAISAQDDHVGSIV